MTKRPTRLNTTFYASAAVSLTLGVALLASSLPARAADDEAPIDQKIYRGIMEGLGLQRDGDAINYQERPPLVIPPSRTLPPPENVNASIAANPAWPKDPDVARRKKEADLARNRNISDERERDARPLRPDQMTPGGNPGPRPRSGSADANSPILGERLSPSELNTKTNFWNSWFGSKENEAAKFTREPPRTTLTAPPPGYQTPSPDQPYGLVKETNTYVPPKVEDRSTLEGRR